MRTSNKKAVVCLIIGVVLMLAFDAMAYGADDTADTGETISGIGRVKAILVLILVFLGYAASMYIIIRWACKKRESKPNKY